MESFKRWFYVGIFLIAASTLLLEITLTKIFSVIHYHYFAFLIVSTALFGYGFSGVLLSVSKRLAAFNKSRVIFFSTLIFGTTTVAAYRLILMVPLKMADVLSNKWQLLHLMTVYLLLAFPFFFSGLAIGVLLTTFSRQINKLYFADLIGAAIGCFAIIVLIPLLGASGTVLIAAELALLSCIAFVEKWKWSLVLVAFMALFAFFIPHEEDYFPIADKSEKRQFQESIKKGKYLYTGWSPAFRIDVVTMGPQLSVIWVDGGTNQSFMHRLSKNDNFAEESPEFAWKMLEVPYTLKPNPKVMIIGPGSGGEVIAAFRYRPASITAVELDPLITKIMLGQFSNYIGHIYTRPNVKLINEEGRSFIRRSQEKFDIIQQKHNTHPMAIASGAMNLTETYLLTKEAFNEYIDHLTPGGFLTIAMHLGLRMLNLGAEVRLERGVKDYWNRMVLVQEGSNRQIFFLKNGNCSEEELDYLDRYFRQKRHYIHHACGIRSIRFSPG